jgi:indole-3-glycerol phosphate synthase
VTALDEITRSVRQDIERRREQVALGDLERSITGRTDDKRPFAEALTSPGISLIAEYKRRSPSAGDLPRGAEPIEQMVQAYERGGAVALSVLTEGTHFGGSLADLRAARAASTLPVLRKDFILDRYQLYEAAAAQADAVLLIVAALDPETLADLHAEAAELDLDCLVEVHDAEELEAALVVDADLIGVNNRDLRDFSVDLARTFDLLPDVPAGKTVVSESGIAAREELDELERVGVDAVLIGETLMRADDPEQACRDLVGVEGEEAELA